MPVAFWHARPSLAFWYITGGILAYFRTWTRQDERLDTPSRVPGRAIISALMRPHVDLATHCVPFSFAASPLHSLSFIPAAALGLLACTLLLFVARPKTLSIGWSALLGAEAGGAS